MSINMKGTKIGRLLVLEDASKRYNREIVWKCICDCGNVFEARGCHIRYGSIQSCGCLADENREKWNNLRHKFKVKSLKDWSE